MAQRTDDGFTPEERAAMKERARELRTASRRRSAADPSEGEADVLAAIAQMGPADRAHAERLHAIVKATAPDLVARTWYGMPAYAKDGKVLCFFQAAEKFKTRYSCLGFNDVANLDDGALWPTAYAIADLTPQVEEQIVELLKRAVS